MDARSGCSPARPVGNADIINPMVRCRARYIPKQRAGDERASVCAQHFRRGLDDWPVHARLTYFSHTHKLASSDLVLCPASWPTRTLPSPLSGVVSLPDMRRHACMEYGQILSWECLGFPSQDIRPHYSTLSVAS